jgi:two-component system sensor histidine kinase MprB
VTLRLRLALWFGLVVAIGIGGAGVLAYLSTESELQQETDDFLRARAAEFAEGARILPSGDGNGGDNRDGRGRGRPNDNDAQNGGDVDIDDVANIFAFDPDSLIQVLDNGGEVISGGSLPVDATDLRLAEFSDPPVIRTINFDGVEYRLITQHLPGQGAVQVARETAETAAVLDRLGTRLGVIGLVVSVLAAAVGWVVAARATTPLRRLSWVAEDIAETQDLSTTVPTGGRDEVGRLATSLDKMIDALATSREQQQRLVMDAGHELRTPLTSLRTNVELLERAPDLPAEERDEILSGVTSEVEELSELVTELVELATDSHNENEPLEPVDLLDVVESAVRRLERRSDRVIVVAGSSSMVMGRGARLDRAIGNLLGNAHKFSPAGEPIDITVGDGRVRVRDRGPGIPVEDLGRVFDRFYRSTVTRPMPGSGLGLAIVAQIIERHGGTWEATNHVDGGAIVGFDLPVISAPS